jgi:glutathione S-transferase
MIVLSAFRWVPPFAQGFVRDVPVRWALEEAGIDYQEKLISAEEQASTVYRQLQPFGQVPAIEVGDLKLFESGAIAMYLAERSEALMPADSNGRARTSAWVFAALHSVEPCIRSLNELDMLAEREEWARERRPQVLEKLRNRLASLEQWLGERDYLERRFTVGDLMMSFVLRSLGSTDLVSGRPVLAAYHERCEARGAFRKAMADHLRPFQTVPCEAKALA